MFLEVCLGLYEGNSGPSVVQQAEATSLPKCPQFIRLHLLTLAPECWESRFKRNLYEWLRPRHLGGRRICMHNSRRAGSSAKLSNLGAHYLGLLYGTKTLSPGRLEGWNTKRFNKDQWPVTSMSSRQLLPNGCCSQMQMTDISSQLGASRVAHLRLVSRYDSKVSCVPALQTNLWSNASSYFLKMMNYR